MLADAAAQILRDFDGLVKAGEMLVVLGQPGSGCPTFLKTIAGLTHGFTVDSSSDIQFQGIPADVMHREFRGEVIYNAETDVHFPHFAFDGNVSRQKYAKHMRDLVMTIFGLSHTVNKVGNDFVRGVSGGERKRVSIAETTSRGLHSASALSFICTLRLATQVTGSTCMVAIYQVSPAICPNSQDVAYCLLNKASQSAYDLFDKSIVLYEGRQIWFGPTEQAKEFGTSRIFVCPPRQTTADFLTSLSNPAERIVAEGFENRVPRTPDEFARVWRESAEYQALVAEIQEYNAEYPVGGAATAGILIALSMDRGWQRLQGDLFIRRQVFGNLIITLIFSKICSVVGAKARQDFVLGSDNFKASFDYEHSHLWRNFGILLAYIVAQKSKGQPLVFTRERLSTSRRPDDEENSTVHERFLPGSEPVKPEDVNIPRQRKIFMWKDVCYDIKLKDGSERRLLDHVDGWIRSGTLTALMGVSGAGKTTLLDVLATRTTIGVVSGEMLVNGRQRHQSFQCKTGYVQQQDLHLATSTVREALEFSALLRQHKSVPKKDKLAYVEEVIALLDMESYASAIVGVPGEGLNVEQRKRLTIGVELDAKPELLVFFDEPSSGLDSQTAWSICQLTRKLANHGQAILSTIHQPSTILMQEFDGLVSDCILYDSGSGIPFSTVVLTVYFGDVGENSKVLTGYFEKHGAHPCPPDANAAEWMLEVIGAARGTKSVQDWPEVWKASEERQQVRTEFDQMVSQLSNVEDAGDSAAGYEPFAMPFKTQFWQCFKRVWIQYWRTPTYIYSKLVLKAQNDLQGLKNQLFSIFLLLLLFGNLTQQIMPLFVEQRALYEARERPSKAYSWMAFLLAQIVVELPWQLLASVIFFVFLVLSDRSVSECGYRRPAQRARSTDVRLCHPVHDLHQYTGNDSAQTAGNIGSLLFSFTLLFCGVLAGPSTVGWWIWANRVSPFTYLVGGMSATGVANSRVECPSVELLHVDPTAGQNCGEYFASYQ
ncbi:hypothetical protein R3P38DRAFT_3620540 [Favolaschia claudopus]|uniref:ABC transporter domain-containing protein n=1 Tax=Favolaschia claudopus TaxID=2862362 RepID=A0AAW0DCH5_9AGAR